MLDISDHGGSLAGSVSPLIKQVLRGTVSFNDTTNYTYTITIPTIDPSKSIVRLNYHPDGENNSSAAIAAQIVNSTTIRVFRSSSGTSKAFSRSIEWEVIEFSSVKSLQKGSTSGSASGTVATINTINPLKSFVFHSSTSSNSVLTTSEARALVSGVTITSPTSLLVRGYSNECYWQVIEFP